MGKRIIRKENTYIVEMSKSTNRQTLQLLVVDNVVLIDRLGDVVMAPVVVLQVLVVRHHRGLLLDDRGVLLDECRALLIVGGRDSGRTTWHHQSLSRMPTLYRTDNGTLYNNARLNVTKKLNSLQRKLEISRILRSLIFSWF